MWQKQHVFRYFSATIRYFSALATWYSLLPEIRRAKPGMFQPKFLKKCLYYTFSHAGDKY